MLEDEIFQILRREKAPLDRLDPLHQGRRYGRAHQFRWNVWPLDENHRLGSVDRWQQKSDSHNEREKQHGRQDNMPFAALDEGPDILSIKRKTLVLFLILLQLPSACHGSFTLFLFPNH